MRFSAFDLQLNKTSEICNKRSATSVIREIRKLVSQDDDITSLTDEDVFKNWRYALISHKGVIIPNSTSSLDLILKITESEILLPHKT